MEFSSTNPLSAPSRTIFLFLWVFLLTSCSGDSEETLQPPLLSSTMHNSLPAPLRERLDEVLASITQAPEDAEKRHLLGVVYQAHGMDRPAAVAFEQAVLLDPQKTRSWYHLARLRSRLGDLEGAVDSMNRCLALDGSHAPSSWYRAQWLFELGRLEEAAEDFQRVIDLAPKEPAGTEGLARLLLASEKPQEAASLLEALLSRDQHATHARYLLGTAYRWLGRTSDAARLLAAGAETPSTIPDTWNDEVHAAAVGYKAIMDAAVAWGLGGKGEKAVPLLLVLHQQYPGDMGVLEKLVAASLQAGQVDQALEIVRDELAQRPEHHRSWFLLALAQEKAGHLDKALTAIAASLERHPTWVSALQLSGRLHFSDGNLDAAAEALTLVLRYGGDNLTEWIKLGTLLLTLGDTGGAKYALEQAQNMDALHPSVLEFETRLQSHRSHPPSEEG